MRIQDISQVFPSLWNRYSGWVISENTVQNSLGSISVTASYREVNSPIHVEPAAKLSLSPEALAILTRTK